MEDKTYELMEKMYVEMQKGFKRIDNLENDVKDIKGEVKDINRTVIKIEVDHGGKLAALFDFQKTQEEVNDRVLSAMDCIDNRLECVETEVFKHTTQLQRIEEKLEIHDTQIHVLDKTKANIK